MSTDTNKLERIQQKFTAVSIVSSLATSITAVYTAYNDITPVRVGYHRDALFRIQVYLSSKCRSSVLGTVGLPVPDCLCGLVVRVPGYRS
jgi:hypothetical protein